MEDPLTPELKLVSALRLTAAPPSAWIEAAALIPDTLRDLEAIEPVVASAEFRDRFRQDPRAAVSGAGLDPSPALVAALRVRVGGQPD